MLTESHERIAALIPFGKEKAISKSELCTLTGFSERKVREIVADLRKNEIFICSTSGSSGYWKPTKRKELEDMADEFHGRAMDCLVTESKIRKYIAIHEDQLKGDINEQVS